ncbi:MAG: MFS transporter [Chloroflexota bacterium]
MRGRRSLEQQEPTGAPLGVRGHRVFYGWWIVLAGALGKGLHAGLNYYGFSAFFIPLSEEFGWSRAVLSGAFSLARVEGGVLGPVEGYLVDKVGPRKMMLVGFALMGAGFVFLSQVNSLLMLYLVYILGITLGGGICASTAPATAIANWFQKRRSLALGILSSGAGVGGGVLLPLLTWLILAFGWRTATVVAGILVWAIGIPLAMVMRHRPEQYGYLPDGAEPSSTSSAPTASVEKEGATASATEQAELGPLQTLRTSAFWLLGLTFSLRAIVASGFSIHFIPMMVDRGMSMTMAGGLLGSVVALSIIGRLGLAWLGDMLDKRYLFAGAMAVMGLTMLGMSQVQSLGAVIAILAVYAVAYGGVLALPFSLQADYFGRKAFATVRSLLHSVQMAGMFVGPIFAGFVFDTTQSYFLALLTFAGVSFLGMLLILGARRPVTQPEPSPGD